MDTRQRTRWSQSGSSSSLTSQAAPESKEPPQAVRVLLINVNDQVVDSGSFQMLVDRRLVDQFRASIQHELSSGLWLTGSYQAAGRQLSLGRIAELQHNHVMPLGCQFQSG
jgi:hypothetical protein